MHVLSIAVHPKLPIHTLDDLVEYAKANPNKLSYGHAGVGSLPHLTGELFKSLVDLEIVPVPYRGTGPVVTDLLGGQLKMAVPGVTAQLIALHRSGRLRILAVTNPVRLAAAPELPTAVELGFPSLTVTSAIGLLAPVGTENQIILNFARAARATIGEPNYQQTLIEGGIEPVLNSTQKASADRWLPILSYGALSSRDWG
jgi:tripartite-type tricarboxylate transporter receptor subunit TctC